MTLNVHLPKATESDGYSDKDMPQILVLYTDEWELKENQFPPAYQDSL